MLIAWKRHPQLAKTLTMLQDGWQERRLMESQQNCSCAFVMTNSVSQGQQAGELWSAIFKSNIRITFAHLSFKWHNLATNKAGVTVVVIGIRQNPIGKCTIYDESSARIVDSIGCYLIPNQKSIIFTENDPISELPDMVFGNMPRDGGYLVMDRAEAKSIKLQANNLDIVRRYVGSKELIGGDQRYCLWIEDNDANAARRIPEIARQLRGIVKNGLRVKLNRQENFLNNRTVSCNAPALLGNSLSRFRASHLRTVIIFLVIC